MGQREERTEQQACAKFHKIFVDAKFLNFFPVSHMLAEQRLGMQSGMAQRKEIGWSAQLD